MYIQRGQYSNIGQTEERTGRSASTRKELEPLLKKRKSSHFKEDLYTNKHKDSQDNHLLHG